MAGRSVNKQVRRVAYGVGTGVGVFLAASVMATSSATTARADFEDLLDPIIQPILTSFTDTIGAFDPAAALDLTNWTDSLLASLDTSFGSLLPSAAEPAAALAAAATPAEAASTGPYDLPITVLEGTEPTVQASYDGGATSSAVLVDSGSSGLVVPLTDLDGGSTNLTNEWDTLLSLGTPSSFGVSGYSGGVEYVYLTYNDVPVTYADGLTTDGPVEVEVYSYNPSDFSSLFTNDAFQNFLANNMSPGGILGIGDNVSGGAGTSPFDSYGSALVELNNSGGGDLIVGDTSNPYTPVETIANNGSTATGLTETITDTSGHSVSATGISDDLDTGGVQGTLPSTISGVAAGDTITVTDPTTGKELYSYTIPNTDAVPSTASGNSIDSGYYALIDHPLYIDYAADKTYLDSLTT